jgi:S1-C subfamily serine protease
MHGNHGRHQRPPLTGWTLFPLVGVLLCFGALNIAVRATSHQLEDGVLWVAHPEGVTASAVAPESGAYRAGIRPGDILVAVEGVPVDTVDAVRHRLGSASEADAL